MNKFIITSILVLGVITCHAKDIVAESDLSVLNNKIEQLKTETQSQSATIKQLQTELEQLKLQSKTMESKSDSVDNELAARISSNAAVSDANHQEATNKITTVENASKSNYHSLTLWGTLSALILLIIAILIYVVLHKGISKGSDAITSIRKAQDNLQEESVKLDTKLVELLDKQIQVQKDVTSSTSKEIVDHSLALKVADEITRIEKNLLRMDPEVKGYKALIKAIERIKNNFSANGYEIVTYMGQPYNEGMRINADFIIDEELPHGTRTITAVSKPQIHYKGQLIQKATVTVSQNI
jgi:hypothetical protein